MRASARRGIIVRGGKAGGTEAGRGAVVRGERKGWKKDDVQREEEREGMPAAPRPPCAQLVECRWTNCRFPRGTLVPLADFSAAAHFC